VTSNGKPDKVCILSQGMPVKPGDTLAVSHAKPALLAARLATTFESLGEMTILADSGQSEPLAVAAAETDLSPR
jgi:hypothetical protein